jgi:hypothetical protein
MDEASSIAPFGEEQKNRVATVDSCFTIRVYDESCCNFIISRGAIEGQKLLFFFKKRVNND